MACHLKKIVDKQPSLFLNLNLRKSVWIFQGKIDKSNHYSSMQSWNWDDFICAYYASHHPIMCVGWRSHSCLILSIQQFLKRNHFMFCLNLYCSFPMPHVKYVPLCWRMNLKRCSNKKVKKVHLIYINLNDSKFHLDRTIVYISTLLAVLPDQHNAIAGMSST